MVTKRRGRAITVQVMERSTKKLVCTIRRVPFHKGFFGNFVPVYVRYMTQEYTLHGGWDYAYMHGTPDEAWIEV